MLQHRAWGNPLGPEKESALAALRRASELLGGETPGMSEDEAKATVAPMGAAGLVLRKVARHERVAIDLLRELARSVHDLRLTELASEVLSAQSERIRLVLAVRLAEAVWAVAHSGEMSAWAETGGDGKRRRRRRSRTANGGQS